MDAQLPGDWLALLFVVFLLGIRHGLDADHLATIDGLTRFNAVARPRLARWSGMLFSLGHGLVVTLVAVLVSLVARHWSVPSWMDSFGTWFSIVFLLTLGVLNLINVMRTPAHDVVRPSGLKGRFLGSLSRAAHPLLIVLVGILFALSFDTLSQATLFSLAATRISGGLLAALLGITFMAGMMITDGMNGLWISRLLSRADRRARIVSRTLGLTIALVSLLVATLGILRCCSEQFAHWGDGHGLAFGIGVITVVLLSYSVSLWLIHPYREAFGSRGVVRQVAGRRFRNSIPESRIPRHG